jgi:hypothetical protein
MDADSFVRSNLDELFAVESSFAAVGNYFSGGFLLLEPNLVTHARMIEALAMHSKFTYGEQDL